MIEVSVLIPTLNEEGNVTRVHSLVSEAFRLLGLEYEVIFIDDNSSNIEAAKRAGMSIIEFESNKDFFKQANQLLKLN